MTKKLAKSLIGIFSGLTTLRFGKQIVVFIISLLPILELRGGLIAAALLDLSPVQSYIICVLGNIIPIPFILLFFGKILNWMRNSKYLSKFAKWLDKKVEKNRGKIEKYGFWGLTLFVGIPLPGTGAWTGCLVASVLNMDKKKSFIYALLGVLLASIIMMIVSFGVLGRLI